jgi:hypothetical protein
VKCADQFEILAKEEAVLQGTIESLTANWKVLWNGNKCGKNLDDENLKATDITDQKQPKNVEYFNYFGSMITNYARYTIISLTSFYAQFFIQ